MRKPPAERPKPPHSMVMTRVGNIDYPLVSVPQCRTCQSPHRLIIENHLISGRTSTGILRELESIDPDNEFHPSAEGIGEHYKRGHMPLTKAVQRRLFERRQEEVGERMNEALGTMMDHVTVAQMIVQKGGEKIATDELVPTVAETLGAAKFLHDIEKTLEDDVDNELWTSAMVIYMESAREVMTDEQWYAFGQRLTTHPILRAIKQKRDAIETNTVDAELVEEEVTP